MNRTIVLPLMFLLPLILHSCGFLPVPQVEYEFRTKGPPPYFYDDFEQNDGTFSTRYFYERNSRPKSKLETKIVYSGKFSASLEAGAKLSTAINALEPGEFSFFLYKNQYTNATHSPLEVTANNNHIDLTIFDYSENDSSKEKWVYASFSLDSGNYKISWENKYDEDYDVPYFCIDELRFSGFMENISPMYQEYYYSSPDVFDWEDFADANKYHLQVSFSDSFMLPIIDVDNVVSSAYTLPYQLEGGKRYYWRIRPFTNGEWREWSGPEIFLLYGPFISDSFEINDGQFSTINAWGLNGNVPPFLQNTVSFDGEWAVEFPKFNAGKSCFYLDVDGLNSKYVTFRVKAEEEPSYADILQFYVGTDYNIVPFNNEHWAIYSHLIPPGLSRLMWQYRRPYNEWSLWIDLVEIFDVDILESDNFENNDGIESKAFSWIYSGDVPPLLKNLGSNWVVEFGGFKGTTTILATSELCCYTEYAEDRSISYDVYVENTDCGWFAVYVDSILDHYVTDQGEWVTKTFTVAEGAHEILFRNSRADHRTTDAFIWLDEIVTSL